MSQYLEPQSDYELALWQILQQAPVLYKMRKNAHSPRLASQARGEWDSLLGCLSWLFARLREGGRDRQLRAVYAKNGSAAETFRKEVYWVAESEVSSALGEVGIYKIYTWLLQSSPRDTHEVLRWRQVLLEAIGDYLYRQAPLVEEELALAVFCLVSGFEGSQPTLTNFRRCWQQLYTTSWFRETGGPAFWEVLQLAINRVEAALLGTPRDRRGGLQESSEKIRMERLLGQALKSEELRDLQRKHWNRLRATYEVEQALQQLLDLREALDKPFQLVSWDQTSTTDQDNEKLSLSEKLPAPLLLPSYDYYLDSNTLCEAGRLSAEFIRATLRQLYEQTKASNLEQFLIYLAHLRLVTRWRMVPLNANYSMFGEVEIKEATLSQAVLTQDLNRRYELFSFLLADFTPPVELARPYFQYPKPVDEPGQLKTELWPYIHGKKYEPATQSGLVRNTLVSPELLSYLLYFIRDIDKLWMNYRGSPLGLAALLYNMVPTLAGWNSGGQSERLPNNFWDIYQGVLKISWLFASACI